MASNLPEWLRESRPPDAGPRRWRDGPALAELEEEIYAAVRRVRSIRSPNLPKELDPGVPDLFGCVFALALIVLYVAISLPVASACAAVYRARLRRRLAQVPPEGRKDVIELLEWEMAGEGREIVAPLLRQVRDRNAVVPAPPPEGRGDEVAPGGRPEPPGRRGETNGLMQ